MCNRYRMTEKKAELAARYGITVPFPPDTYIPPPELFPKKPAYIVRQIEAGLTLDTAIWGFPHQARGASGKMLDMAITNVRNLSSLFWRSALATPARRCLVPVTAFSEYGPGPKSAKPLHWFDVPTQPIFSFAGLWRPIGDGKAFAFLTCEPNVMVAPIHPKAMPVILHEEDEERWLNADLDVALALVAPFPSQLMGIAELLA